MRIKKDRIFITWIACCLTLSGCTGAGTAASTSTATLAPAITPTPTVTSTPAIPATSTLTPMFTATPIPFPTLTLKPGENYFSIDGKPGFIFSRNIAGYEQDHYNTFLDWMKTGGSKLARIQLDSLGMGYTSSGGVDENWAAQWDRVFDKAEADGIYILPVFSGWFDWNSGTGYSTWKSNPLNAANGGPVKSPAELFQKDSATQILWLQWMQTLVKRWQSRRNIPAWEIFSEVNLASGGTESTGISFVNLAASMIRASDPSRRPVTASLADDGRWPNFYRATEIDFINIHPYPTDSRLDRFVVAGVRQFLTAYKKPVLIGESDLVDPSKNPDADKALIGVRHAIWAGLVSGAMNGRALYWEDSFAIYFQNLGYPFLQKFADADLPASRFVQGVDFSGFKPLVSTSSSAVWGATVGNETMVIGWYRDAASEPPDWNLKPKISKQTVTITVPGTAANWKIDFYNTKTGTDIVNSATVIRKGDKLTITLPDFSDDIAFKLYVQK
jgi:hypothetical protein